MIQAQSRNTPLNKIVSFTFIKVFECFYYTYTHTHWWRWGLTDLVIYVFKDQRDKITSVSSWEND